MKSLLPNCRWLTLESEDLGRDWREKAQVIDDKLEGLGMDLNEESVFLLFDQSPEKVLQGDARCLIARSVIGPKKNLEGEIELKDWIQSLVFKRKINAKTWEELLLECLREWKTITKTDASLTSGFMVVLQRRLHSELSLGSEVIFHE